MKTAVKCEKLTKKFKDKTAVSEIDLEICEGELFSLLGVNGAGKSTTVRMLSCLTSPTSGDAEIFGKSIVSKPLEVKKEIAVCPQETAVAKNLTVKENLVFTANIYFPKEEAKKKADEIFKIFFKEDEAKKRAKTLSGGQQRKLSIAMALISEPKVLFLDEPTLGLDVIARHELWNFIKTLKGRMTILLTTHYMEEAEHLSDRVAVMREGEIKTVGTPAEIIEKSGKNTFEEAFVHFAAGGYSYENA